MFHQKRKELIFQPRTVVFNNNIGFEIVADSVVLDWVRFVGIEPELIKSETPYGITLTILFTMREVVMTKTVIEFDPLSEVESAFLRHMINQCITPVTVIDVENPNRKICKPWKLTPEKRKSLLQDIAYCQSYNLSIDCYDFQQAIHW